MTPTWKQSKSNRDTFTARGRLYFYGYNKQTKQMLLDVNLMRVVLHVKTLDRAKMIANLLEKK